MKLTNLEIAIMETMEAIYTEYWLGNKAIPYFYNDPEIRDGVVSGEIEFPFVLKYEDGFYLLHEYYDRELVNDIAQTYLSETVDDPNCPPDYLEELAKEMWGEDYKWYGAQPSGLDECVTEDRQLPDDYVAKNNMHKYHPFSGR